MEKELRKGQYPCSVRTRLSKEHYDNLIEDAQIAGMSVCKYVRQRLEGRQIRSRYDVQLLNELRRQGGLLKHLAHHGVDTEVALLEVIKTMKILQQGA